MKKYLFPIDTLVVWCPTWSKNLGRSLSIMLQVQNCKIKCAKNWLLIKVHLLSARICIEMPKLGSGIFIPKIVPVAKLDSSNWSLNIWKIQVLTRHDVTNPIINIPDFGSNPICLEHGDTSLTFFGMFLYFSSWDVMERVEFANLKK